MLIRRLARAFSGAALLLALMLGAVALGCGPAMAAAAVQPPAAPQIVVDMRLANIYGFSTNDKSYTVEGTIWLTYPEVVEQDLAKQNANAINLIRFYNNIEPWNFEIRDLEPEAVKLNDGNFRRSYLFNGKFYSDEVDFRRSPFGDLILEVTVQSIPTLLDSNPSTQNLKLIAGQSELGSRVNINGYEYDSWSFQPISRNKDSKLENSRSAEPSRLQFVVHYKTNLFSAFVEWILPLLIVMSLTILAPNIASSMGSERLAIPPVVLLTIVLMQQAYRESLPSLPYLTFLDGIYAYSYLVTLAIFVSFIISSNLIDSATSDDRRRIVSRRIDRIDWLVQIAAISGYVALTLGSFVRAGAVD